MVSGEELSVTAELQLGDRLGFGVDDPEVCPIPGQSLGREHRIIILFERGERCGIEADQPAVK